MAPIIAALFPSLIEIGSNIAKSFFPNPEEETKRELFKQQFTVQLMEQSQAIEKLAAEVVKTEAESEYWLTANWRPLTMLTFVALIVARWLGFAAIGMSESEYLSLYDLIKIGLGGYVVGRSAEKIVPQVAEIWARNK